MVKELEHFRALSAEAQAEKELLAAERTLLIMHLQEVAAVPASGASGLTGYDQAATQQAEARVNALCGALAPNNGVRVLTETSELVAHIKVMTECIVYT